MPKDFLPKEQKSPHATKPTASLEDLPAFDDLKELDEDREITTERVLIGGLGIEDNKAGLPQATLRTAQITDKDVYVVTFDISATDRPDDILTHFFNCNYPSEILSISEVHGTNTSGACTVQIERIPSGTSLGSGTDLLTTAFNLATGANTPVTKTKTDMVSGEVFIDKNERLGITLASGSTAALQFLSITVYLQIRNKGQYRHA